MSLWAKCGVTLIEEKTGSEKFLSDWGLRSHRKWQGWAGNPGHLALETVLGPSAASAWLLLSPDFLVLPAWSLEAGINLLFEQVDKCLVLLSISLSFQIQWSPRPLWSFPPVLRLLGAHSAPAGPFSWCCSAPIWILVHLASWFFPFQMSCLPLRQWAPREHCFYPPLGVAHREPLGHCCDPASLCRHLSAYTLPRQPALKPTKAFRGRV